MTLSLDEMGCPKDCKYRYGYGGVYEYGADACCCEFSKNPCIHQKNFILKDKTEEDK